MSKSRTKKSIKAAKKAAAEKSKKSMVHVDYEALEPRAVAASMNEKKEEPSDGMFLPQEVSNADIVFPAGVRHLMPPLGGEPGPSKKAINFVDIWFYIGVPGLKFSTKPGIDPKMAIRHMKCIMGSFQPKHEHKVEAVARLADMWFDEYTW